MLITSGWLANTATQGGIAPFSLFANNTWVADVNGDGLTDYMWVQAGVQAGEPLAVSGSRNAVWVAKSTGDGFTTPQIWLPETTSAGVLAYSTRGEAAWAADVNGDGLTDYIWIPAGRSDLWVAKSTGDDFTTPELWLAANAAEGASSYSTGGARTWLADVNSDGLTDYLWMPEGQSDIWVAKSRGAPFGVIDQVTNGAGITTDVGYYSLSDTATNIYTKGSDSVYPDRDIQAPLYVVGSVSSSDAVGGTRSSNYRYTSLKANLHGRGLLGFRTVEITDNETATINATTYHQDFPLTGRSETNKTRQIVVSSPGSPSGESPSSRPSGLLSVVSSSWDAIAVDGSLYEVKARANTVEAYELDGSLVSTIVTSYSNYRGYGDVEKMTVTTTDGSEQFITQTINEYAPDNTTNWVLGRLSRSVVIQTTPSGVSSRTSAFEYRADGLLQAETIEPDDATLRLRKAYTYDGYGNQTSVTVSDAGLGTQYPILTAVSTSEYDYSNLAVDGTYTTTDINAKGHSEIRVVDAAFGNIRFLTGPNGLTTQWRYDGFGRKLKEIRADGNETDWRYAWCDANCPQYAEYTLTTQQTGSVPVTRYLDALDREVRSATVGLTGRTILKDTKYNNLG